MSVFNCFKSNCDDDPIFSLNGCQTNIMLIRSLLIGANQSPYNTVTASKETVRWGQRKALVNLL